MEIPRKITFYITFTGDFWSSKKTKNRCRTASGVSHGVTVAVGPGAGKKILANPTGYASITAMSGGDSTVFKDFPSPANGASSLSYKDGFRFEWDETTFTERLGKHTQVK